MIREIVQIGHPVLRMTARKVHHIDGSVEQLIEDMVDSMNSVNGIGLAAPQLGVPLRVVVIDLDELRILVNPEISVLSNETDVADEGCLSIRGYTGPVERSVTCTVRALNERGKKVKIKADGWLARCLQHEIDHLNGILYTDHIQDKTLIRRANEDYEVEPDDEHTAASASDAAVAEVTAQVS